MVLKRVVFTIAAVLIFFKVPIKDDRLNLSPALDTEKSDKYIMPSFIRVEKIFFYY
jgi:hypothetical protein